MAKIAVVYYSTWGHVLKLAETIAIGARKVAGAQVDIFQVQETLPEEVLGKMHAAPKAAYPVITPDELAKYDGFLFGIPTRYGVWPAQWKTFIDATGQNWAKGSYYGKFGGVFTSTASQHGGVETTGLTALTFFVHQGIIFVPLGYAKAFKDLSVLNEVIGASPYGAGTIAGGDGSRHVSALELQIAEIQGEEFAKVVVKHHKQ